MLVRPWRLWNTRVTNFHIQYRPVLSPYRRGLPMSSGIVNDELSEDLDVPTYIKNSLIDSQKCL